MEENKKTKQELLEQSQKLAEKHTEIKSVIIGMLDEMDKIEVEYNEIIEQIKKN